jgi:DNA-binding MarR family transcriptional regulator
MNAGREYSTAAVMLHGAIAARFELSATDLKALDVLQRVGRLTAGEIAAHTRLATASVTSLIDRLEVKGFVKRERDAKDRRRVVVAPTLQLEKAIAPLFESLNRRMLARFARYTLAEARLLREFLAAGARDMFDESARLGK